MNRKGFTLIELIAILLILGVVCTITVYSMSSIFKNAKEKSEDVFVETIKDALDMYLSTDAKKEDFIYSCSDTIGKTHGRVTVYKTTITFSKVINSSYSPISADDIVNPANKDAICNDDFSVTLYKDSDNVYYYSFNREDLGCLTKSGIISNLPEGFSC